MFPFSLVGEETNFPRLLLPVLSGKEKERGRDDVVQAITEGGGWLPVQEALGPTAHTLHCQVSKLCPS